MAEDARFEDASEAPVNLQALDGEDLQIIAALTQDAIFPVTEMRWNPKRREFAILLNRFRWELTNSIEAGRLKPERVQSVLFFRDVRTVASQGIDRQDDQLVLSLLSIGAEFSDDGSVRVELVLAGDGAIALDLEALDATLKDVTRPYHAPSGHVPQHP